MVADVLRGTPKGATNSWEKSGLFKFVQVKGIPDLLEKVQERAHKKKPGFCAPSEWGKGAPINWGGEQSPPPQSNPQSKLLRRNLPLGKAIATKERISSQKGS